MTGIVKHPYKFDFMNEMEESILENLLTYHILTACVIIIVILMPRQLHFPMVDQTFSRILNITLAIEITNQEKAQSK